MRDSLIGSGVKVDKKLLNDDWRIISEKRHEIGPKSSKINFQFFSNFFSKGNESNSAIFKNIVDLRLIEDRWRAIGSQTSRKANICRHTHAMASFDGPWLPLSCNGGCCCRKRTMGKIKVSFFNRIYHFNSRTGAKSGAAGGSLAGATKIWDPGVPGLQRCLPHYAALWKGTWTRNGAAVAAKASEDFCFGEFSLSLHSGPIQVNKVNSKVGNGLGTCRSGDCSGRRGYLLPRWIVDWYGGASLGVIGVMFPLVLSML